MSASNSSGIQTLLEAEHNAQEIVQQARAFRAQRIKASKADAVAEIEKYKTKKEQEFQSSTSQSQTGDAKAEDVAAEQAKSEIAKIQKDTKAKEANVLKFILDSALTPSVPS